MSNTEEKTNEMDETLEKVIVEEEGHSFLQNESEKETDPNLQNDDQFAADDNEVTLEGLVKERDDLKDKLMRSLAESENIRKRALKDRQELARTCAAYGRSPSEIERYATCTSECTSRGDTGEVG